MAAFSSGSAQVNAVEDLDPLAIGKRIRRARKARGWTLTQLGGRVERAPSLLSDIENGHREAKLSLLKAIAEALGVPIVDLLAGPELSRRDELEIQVRRMQDQPSYRTLGLPQFRLTRALGTDVLEAIVAQHREIERLTAVQAASTEEARRANTALRAQMRQVNNYFPDLEAQAIRLRRAIDRPDGPLTTDDALALAGHLGFEVRLVPDLPHSARSITELSEHRIYIPDSHPRGPFSRAILLSALGAHVLAHREPDSYAEFLRQRIETNYLSAAMLVPEAGAVALLRRAKARREICLPTLGSTYQVWLETAFHRFTNLATRHLDLTVHFAKIHQGGAISKAYENDGLEFPTDVFGNIEGQHACRWWAGRQAMTASESHSQYTDTPSGTYWDTALVQRDADGVFTLSLGVPFAESKWFEGRDTTNRARSTCPDPRCCRTPTGSAPASQVRAAARPHASVLASLPQGPFPGVDAQDVYQFLAAHRDRLPGATPATGST